MPEPKKHIIVDGIEFTRLFLFPKIFSAVTASLQPARLLIALLMIVALIAFGRVWDRLAPIASDSPEARTQQRVLREAITEFRPQEGSEIQLEDATLSHRDVLRRIDREYQIRRSAAATDDARTRLDAEYVETVNRIHAARPIGPFEALTGYVTSSFRAIVRGIFGLNLWQVIDAAGNLLIDIPIVAWGSHPWFAILFGAFFLLVFTIGGGAIARMAAVQFALQERLAIRQAVDFAFGNWVRLLIAQALPLAIVLGLCLVVMLMGVLLGAPVLDVLGGWLYGLGLLVGFLIAFLLLGYAIGFPLLVPAVACENCDGADAMQRAYAYVVTRPLHLVFYWIIALIGLALGVLLVSLFALMMLNLTASLYDVLIDHPALRFAGGYQLFELSRPAVEAVPGNWHQRWTGTAILFWEGVIVCLVGAYILAYTFGASTILYLLMRRASDGQDIEEIWQPGLVRGTTAPEPEMAANAVPAEAAGAPPQEATGNGVD